MLTLYFSPGACSMASHIALEETGAPVRGKTDSPAEGRAENRGVSQYRASIVSALHALGAFRGGRGRAGHGKGAWAEIVLGQLESGVCHIRSRIGRQRSNLVGRRSVPRLLHTYSPRLQSMRAGANQGDGSNCNALSERSSARCSKRQPAREPARGLVKQLFAVIDLLHGAPLKRNSGPYFGSASTLRATSLRREEE